MSICVIPGCAVRVAESGDTCAGCVTAFGQMLRPSEVRLTDDEIRERDAYVARAYSAQRNSRC